MLLLLTKLARIGFVQDKFAFPNALEFLELAVKKDVGHTEFKFEADLDAKFDLRGATAKNLRAIASANRINLSVHAPYNKGVSLGDVDPQIRSNTKKQMLNCLEFAEKIEAQYITVHGGFFEIEHQQSVTKSLGKPDRIRVKDLVSKASYGDLKKRTIDELGWLIEQGNKHGVKIALENFHDFSSFKVRFPLVPEDFQECRLALGDTFFINYDSGHGHSTGIHIVDFIEQLGVENVVGTHLHDNNEKADLHLPIFQGTVDFTAFFERYKQEGWNFPLNLESKNYQDLMAGLQVLEQQIGSGLGGEK